MKNQPSLNEIKFRTEPQCPAQHLQHNPLIRLREIIFKLEFIKAVKFN